MTIDEVNRLMHDVLHELVCKVNTTGYALAGDLLYIDPEFTIDYRKNFQDKPYMSIPFWAGVSETGLKYTLHTNVIDTGTFICIDNANGENVAALWSDKISIDIVDVVLGRQLYILNYLYWKIKLGLEAHSSDLDVITVLTQVALDIWGVVPPGTLRDEYSESILTGLSSKYDEMLARTELASDAFKQQKE